MSIICELAYLIHSILKEAYQANGNQSRASVPANQRKLVGEPIQWKVIPIFISNPSWNGLCRCLPCPCSVFLWCWLEIFIGPPRVAYGSLAFIALWRSDEINECSF
jgi:hypothetical protein